MFGIVLARRFLRDHLPHRHATRVRHVLPSNSPPRPALLWSDFVWSNRSTIAMPTMHSAFSTDSHWSRQGHLHLYICIRSTMEHNGMLPGTIEKKKGEEKIHSSCMQTMECWKFDGQKLTLFSSARDLITASQPIGCWTVYTLQPGLMTPLLCHAIAWIVSPNTAVCSKPNDVMPTVFVFLFIFSDKQKSDDKNKYAVQIIIRSCKWVKW